MLKLSDLGRMSARRFPFIITALCIIYFVLQTAYILRLPLVMDEFESAATVIDLTERLPYRDFRPYKTLVGHYIQLPAMLLGEPPWQPLMYVKFQMALLNTAALATVAVMLTRAFPHMAVTLGIAMMILMSNFLERSSELRVDMLTAWSGLFSLLFVLRRNWSLAGILSGLSFLISQKGIYFALAGGVSSLVAGTGVGLAPRSGLAPALRFSMGALAVVLTYLLFWSLATSWDGVYYATFIGPQRVAFQSLYEDLRQTYWLQSIERNPAFYGFALVALLQMALEPRKSTDPARDRLILSYGAVLLGLSLWHKQPWPYFFVLVVPTLTVLSIVLFDRTVQSAATGRQLLGLPRPLGMIYIFGALTIPLVRVPVNLFRDNGFQKEMVELAHCILAPDEGYLAGVDMVYSRKQPVGTLRWIDRPRADMLQRMDTAGINALVDSLGTTPVKLVIENYRTQELPAELRHYIEQEYTPFWGSILLYGPAVSAGQQAIAIRFSGIYGVSTPDGTDISIDDRLFAHGSRLPLDAGLHHVASMQGVRLTLTAPACVAAADPRHREAAELFPTVYTY